MYMHTSKQLTIQARAMCVLRKYRNALAQDIAIK